MKGLPDEVNSKRAEKTLISRRLSKAKRSSDASARHDKESPEDGRREDGQREATALAAHEARFGAYKCTTVCSARDEYLQIPPICSMHFDQRALVRLLI